MSYIEKTELKKFNQKLKKLKLKKIWVGVMILSQKIITNLLKYRQNLVMKNFIKKETFTMLF